MFFVRIDEPPQVGFEPTTNRLTADRSTPELLRKFYTLFILITDYTFCLELK